MRDKLNQYIYIMGWSLIIILNGVFIWNIEKIFPEKYFSDSFHIINLINNNLYHTVGQSYRITAKFFSLIKFQELKYYNLSIYFVFLMFFIWYLYKYYSDKLYINFFNLIYLFLASIYLIRPGKEFLQFLIVGLCFKYTKFSWFFLIVGGLLFRKYLVIQAIFFIAILLFYKSNKKLNIIIVFILSIVLTSYIFPDIILKILNVRTEVNVNRIGKDNAITIINNIFKSKNIVVGYINYFINISRILFPLELIKKKIKYLPYVVFQIWFTLKLIVWRNRKDYRVYLLYSFILISGVFEPDFGSFLRHTIPYFIIIVDLIVYKGESKYEKNSFDCIRA